jgi:DNA-binding transcriptional ArsR family regulator
MTLAEMSTLEKLFLALADKTRLRLLALMANGEVTVGYLAGQLDESQPKTSRHLAYLRGMGLTTTRRDGKWIYYGIAKQADPHADLVLRTVLSAITQTGVLPAAPPPDIETESPGPDGETSIAETPASSSELAIYLL